MVCCRQNLNIVARDEITRLLRHAIDEREQRRNEFTERNKVDLVVASNFHSIRPKQHSGIHRLMSGRIGDGSKQNITVAQSNLGGGTVEFGVVVIVERRW